MARHFVNYIKTDEIEIPEDVRDLLWQSAGISEYVFGFMASILELAFRRGVDVGRDEMKAELQKGQKGD